MDVKDITEQQFGTLVLIRSLEEFINVKDEELATLGKVVQNFSESLDVEDTEQYWLDICRLTKQGYLVSDAEEENIELFNCGEAPTVEGITPKGKLALDEWEREMQQKSMEKPDGQDTYNVTVINNYFKKVSA